ncbi:AraC family transcriptional regulator [Novosphingobium rosa]|uniref:AraC family transcriptional regulator n=1 Tax=Novosphingobium rosa TaxID=76978 RepID=UPI001FE0C5D5|nr:AraC family transcriptional regulator [Novosphingobium rosa]
MCRRVQRHTDDLRWETPVPRVGLCVLRETGQPVTSVYQPMACLVLQGAKEATIGDRHLRYDAASCFIATVDVAVTGQVTQASSERPYVVTCLSLDHQALAALLADLPVDGRFADSAQQPTEAFGVAPVTRDLLEAWDQLLALLDRPEDIPVLGAARERAVLYRLLQGGHGAMLRQVAQADSRLSRIRQVIEHIRRHFDQPLRTEVLATIAGMSVPSFHRHFKAATGMSPLQYQKSLRLQTARRLLSTSAEAARTAFAVGYESASQFSREYARQFGLSPSRDAALMQGGSWRGGALI